MQDSDLLGGFTAGADIYAGYVLSDDGQGHDNYAAMCALPFVVGKKTLSICTRFNATADCLDYEGETTGTGPMQAQDAVAWTQRMRAAGRVPWNYCNESTWPELKSAYASARVVVPIWWVANTSKPAGSIVGADAHQYSFNLPANRYDSSAVVDYIPGFDTGDVPSGGGSTPITPTPGPYVGDGDLDITQNQLLVDVHGAAGRNEATLVKLLQYLIGQNEAGALSNPPSGRSTAYTVDLDHDTLNAMQAQLTALQDQVTALKAALPK